MRNAERFEALLNGRTDIDRTPVIEWASWWHLTQQAWEEQGIPKMDGWGLCNHWGHDKLKQFWLPTMESGCPKPRTHGGGLIENEQDYEEINP